jgi:hypothetical protein
MLNITNSGSSNNMIFTMLLPLVPEIHHLRLTTVFGQNAYLSDQSPSSSFLSKNQKITSRHLIILSPLSRINDGETVFKNKCNILITNAYLMMFLSLSAMF